MMSYKPLLILFALIVLAGFLVKEPTAIPVKNASVNDWNQKSFWHSGWGASGVHKGIDIFAAKGTPVVASTHLIILYSGTLGRGGNVVLGLGPKWRLHYFAHLASVVVDVGQTVKVGSAIGTVGDTGNAKGKQAHLHFSVLTIIPYLWRIDTSEEGFKKIIYLDPSHYFLNQ